MWYERDFTIPVFCKKVRFEYDRKTGNYTGKFKISEHQSQKIIEKLEYCKERASEANKKNSIKNEENLDSLSPGVLNCTYVWNFMLRYDYEKEELKYLFPEFREYEGMCRFNGCDHVHEPGCAVKEALEEGKIHKIRYQNYIEMYEELKNKRRY